MQRQSALARQFGSVQTRAQARAASAKGSRATALQIRRVPAPQYGPELTYGDWMQAEQVAMRPQAQGRYQAVASKEVKCFDVALTDSGAGGINWLLAAAAFAEPGVAFTGITELNDILQGSTVYQRIGIKVLMKNIRIRGTLLPSAATVIGCVRVAVVYDRQPNGAAAAVGDIFQDCTAGAATNFSSGVNMSNKNRFTILRDQIFNFDAAQSIVHAIDWFIPCRLQAEYKASGGTIGDITTGSVLLVVGEVLGGAGTVGFANFRSRIRYED